MKTLVVVCALVACCSASAAWSGYWGPNLLYPGASHVAYAVPAAYSYRHIAPAPAVFAPTYAAAPAQAVIAAPAPAVVAAKTVVAAPAPAVFAAPAPTVVATKTVVAAPAPAVFAAPAPAVVAAKTVVAAPAVVAAAPAVVAAAPAVTKTQYHSQDELGQATYGHAEPLQTHNAVQDAHGNKVGSFSYFNPHDGQVHRTDYVADALGYRVAANDLPIDTPEVALAKAAHLTAHAHLRERRSVVALETPASTVPLATPVFAATPYWGASAAVVSHHTPVLGATPYFAAPAPAVVAAPASAVVAAPAALPYPAHRAATLTTVVNTPGHAVSYRVD